MSSYSGYWTQKVNRRKALRGAALTGAGLGAWGLVGCGATNSDNSAQTPSEEVLDATQGKPGGTLVFMQANLTGVLDPIANAQSSIVRMAGLCHSALLSYRMGQAGVEAYDPSVEPDLAQAMPEQPDNLSFTFKLRAAKFHNGRSVTSDDVKYSFDRYASDKSAFRTSWDWYERVDTPDPQTAIVRTKYPFADALQYLAALRDSFIVAKEYAEGPDVSNKFMGSGPFLHTAYEPGVSAFFKKNPDYYSKPFPYFDELKGFLGGDVAKRVADFSGRNYNVTWWFAIEDIDQLKRNRPDAKFELLENSGDRVYMRTDRAPFNDPRVRQALSMGMNRSAIRQATSAGLGVLDSQFGVIHSYWGARAVKDIPGAAKYWDFNPTEAKRLLAAAGHDRPIEANWTYYSDNLTAAYSGRVTLTQAHWKENGIAAIKENVVTNPVFNTTVARGNYEGVASGPGGVDPQHGTFIQRYYYTSPQGTAGLNNYSLYNSSRANQLLEKQRGQFNLNERRTTFRELEQVLAEDQPIVQWDTYPVSYFWDPTIKNARMPIFQGNFSYARRWWYA